MISRILFTIAFWLAIDLYFFQGFKTAISGMQLGTRKWLIGIFWAFDLLIVVAFIYLAMTDALRPNGSRFNTFLIGAMFLSLLPKLIVLPILLSEDIVRVMHSGVTWVQSMISPEKPAYFASRRKFVSQLAVGLAAIPFAGVLYGITKGKYNYRVIRQSIFFKDLPSAFDGFTITQLSDIHVGSFDDKKSVEYGVALANEQRSDLMVFTGDLVNAKANEMDPWKDVFSALSAPFGKFSILGNHDYGDYVKWPSAEAKAENFEQMKATHKEIGFQLMLNQHTKIEKDGQSFDLIGLENWGRGRFGKYGDLNAATANTIPDSFKILLSHDPSHWEAETLKHEKHIHLTLSGHTHGLQFGVDIPWLKWSPIKYVYTQWSGLYTLAERHIYVNRGFGFLGFPGRVGMWPEITVITLRKGEA
jgi:uncharacterized protein